MVCKSCGKAVRGRPPDRASRNIANSCATAHLPPCADFTRIPRLFRHYRIRWTGPKASTHEQKNIPTEQPQAQAYPRLPRTDGHAQRAHRAEAPPREGPQAPGGLIGPAAAMYGGRGISPAGTPAELRAVQGSFRRLPVPGFDTRIARACAPERAGACTLGDRRRQKELPEGNLAQPRETPGSRIVPAQSARIGWPRYHRSGAPRHR